MNPQLSTFLLIFKHLSYWLLPKKIHFFLLFSYSNATSCTKYSSNNCKIEFT